MKSLILILLLIPSLAFGLSPAIIGNMSLSSSSAVVDHCDAGCTGEADADTVCVDSETGVAECSFSDTVGGSSTVEWDASHIGTICCADAGSYALEHTVADGDTTYTRADLGSEKAIFSIQFYFLVHSETLSDTEAHNIFYSWNAALAYQSFSLSLIDASGSLKLRTTLNQTSVSTIVSTKTISLDTWYRVRVFFDDEDAFTVNLSDCDGNNNELIQNLGDAEVNGSYPVRIIQFGKALAASGAVNFQIDNFKADDDTAITTGCD